MDNLFYHLTSEPIVIDSVRHFISRPAHGAEVIFLGAVRDNAQGRSVIAMDYEAYTPLAEQVFREIGEAALVRWGPACCIYIVHRVGSLRLCDVSIAIGISTVHRAEAYAANRFIIEEIKHRAPIWKKEYFEDGESAWVKGCSLCASPEPHQEPERA